MLSKKQLDGLLSCRLLITKWLAVCVLLLCGCGTEQESLHEHDHELPAHWPSSIIDAVAKLQQRIEILTSDAEGVGPAENEAWTELRDLVEWAPEIAADTELSEEDWHPIYESSEVLRRKLASGSGNVAELRDDFDRMIAALRAAYEKLPPSNDLIDQEA